MKALNLFRLKLLFVSAILFFIASIAGAKVVENCRNKYLTPGREDMFEQSLSGLRDAYQHFDAGVQDSICTGNDMRELKFLHAATQAAMIFIDNKDSFLELAEGFGVGVIGDYFETLDVNVPLTKNGKYKIPSGAPNANEISDMIKGSITEIDGIIAELNTISDTASNRFRIFFTPGETGLDKNLEVDYGEVLILKGLLLALKSQLETKLAHDVFVDVNKKLLDKLLYTNGVNPDDVNSAELAAIIGISNPDNININNDFLTPYPNLLKVLPTKGHAEKGADILAKSKKDLIASIDNYFKAVNYILAETDAQGDDLFYFDPNDKLSLDAVNQKLTALRDSLKNDTVITFPFETTKTYSVYDSKSKLIGQMILVYDLSGLEGEAKSLTFTKTGVPTPWEVSWFDIYDNTKFEADLECYSPSHWWEGYMEGTLSANGNITNVTLYYWGDSGGTLEKLSCKLISTAVTNISINFNPIFGSTKYPKPVNPRDILPQFDKNNQPLAGTFGHGLGNDATLGGILPGMTQKNWTNLFKLPAALPIVPNVAGLTTAKADAAIIKAGLKVGKVTTDYSNTIAAGSVISTDPVAGTAVAANSKVNYVKSLGKSAAVPNVAGLTTAKADAAIIKANLKVGKVTTDYSNTIAAGSVISTDPVAGTAVAANSKVNYVKSLGKSAAVPNVAGLTTAKADAAIIKASLKVGTVTTEYSNTIVAGGVISTDPVAGKIVAAGSKVNYVKSLGKPKVPKIVGLTAAAANTAIVNAKLVVGIVTTANSNTVAAGKVISSNPVAGTAVLLGSKVNYVKSLGKAK